MRPRLLIRAFRPRRRRRGWRRCRHVNGGPSQGRPFLPGRVRGLRCMKPDALRPEEVVRARCWRGLLLIGTKDAELAFSNSSNKA